jgi:hypothetical protein
MAVPVGQNLIREYITLLLHRGMRHAAVDGNDIFRVFEVAASGSVPATANKTYMVIEMDDATMALLDEKAFSMDHPHVPDTTRQ